MVEFLGDERDEALSALEAALKAKNKAEDDLRSAEVSGFQILCLRVLIGPIVF
jgi:hypothetical protein